MTRILQRCLRDLATIGKIYWSVLKTFANGRKIPVILYYLMVISFLIFRFKPIILTTVRNVLQCYNELLCNTNPKVSFNLKS